MSGFLATLAEIRDDRGTVRAIKHVENTLHYGANFGFIVLDEEVKGAKKWSVPASRRLRAWKHGFTVDLWVQLELGDRDPGRYLNLVDKHVRLARANKPYGEIVANKACFYAWFDEFDDHLPTTHGSIIRGEFVPGSGEREDDLAAILDREGRLVLKPVHGHRGQGVRFLAKRDDGYRLRGGEEDRRFESRAGLRRALGDLYSYLVSEHVRQHPYAERIYPETTNTIRVLTIVDPETGEPFVARAAHRFGSDETRPLDSWSQGGVGVPIEVDSGTMRDAHTQDVPHGVVTRRSHPDTGARLAGVDIPRWGEIRDTTLRFADEITGAPYLSWDVLLSPDGPVVIEANSPGGIDLVQLEAGLLEDERCRRALEPYL